MKRIFKSILAISLCALLLLGTVEIGGDGLSDVIDTFVMKVNAEKITSYSTGDIIEFGWYPQTKETDSTIISVLNSSGGAWTSYNYYSGTGDYHDGQMTSSDYMRYKDVMYGTTKYRGVVFDSYRPYFTGDTSSTSNTYQVDNGYVIGTTYWFKYEPIKWRVLDPSTGLVLSETILDSQAYNNYILSSGTDEYSNTAYWGDSAKTYYANNYAKSSIRQWLNDDFYNCAFSTSQQNIIQSTTLDNSAYSSDYSAYGSASTTDKIFLLSYSDTLNNNYGFNTNTGSLSTRTAKGSDYAKCQGLVVLTIGSFRGNSYWRLRSAGCRSDYACYVNHDGIVNDYYNTYNSDIGVRAALKLNLTSDIFQSSVNETVKNAFDCNAVVYYGSYANLSTQASTIKLSGYSGNVGDVIEFGSYPQTKETDLAVISALNELAGDNKEWTSYNYYSGTGTVNNGQMKPSNYMRYIDVAYGNAKYRGVVFNSYRPMRTGYSASASNTYQYENGYMAGETYWFKYEPIKWRVLDPKEGLVLTETIIDSQAYNNYILFESGKSDSYYNYTYWGDTSKTYFANNYENSSIRQWLNNDFYNTAFSVNQQNMILTTTLDNSAYSTSYSAYDSVSTTDKIFLLSYSDTLYNNYGFSTDTGSLSTRTAQGSDYAKCQGLYVSVSSGYSGNSLWRVRSGGSASGGAIGVRYDGGINYACDVNDTSNGVRAALRVNLSLKEFTSDNFIRIYDGVNTDEYAVIYGDEGDLLPELITPTRDGYIFIGWVWNRKIPKTLSGNQLTATAQWAKGVIVTFDNNGHGVAPKPKTIEQNATVSAPNELTETGYRQVGWFTDKECQQYFDFNTKITEDITLYALWLSDEQYVIKYDTCGGNDISPVILNTGDDIVLPNNPTRDGYVFAGWTWSTGSNMPPAKMPEKDLTATAQWNKNPLVTFDMKGHGSAISQETVIYNTSVDKPEDSSEPGYIFGGWYTDSLCTNAYDFNTLLTSDITLYAKWTINQYTISFNTGCNKTVPSITQDFGTTVKKDDEVISSASFTYPESAHPYTSNLTKTYNFSYSGVDWLKVKFSEDCNVENYCDYIYVYSGTNCSGTLLGTYTGSELANKEISISGNCFSVKITSDAQNEYYGFSIDSITTNTGYKLENLKDSDRPGYTFLCWDKDVPYIMPAENIEITALWIANEYTLYFEGDGTEELEPITQVYGSNIEMPNIDKEHYEFDGWDFYDNEDKLIGSVLTTMPAYNVVAKPRWIAKKYNLTIYPNGGSFITKTDGENIIEFGSYPQTKEMDLAIISALNELAGDNKEWTSYNYYSGTGDEFDGKMKASNYMRYKDVMYGTTKYRGVVFDSYRPYYTGETSSTSNTYQDDNGYTIGTTYWFKYEPIKWRVLDPTTGLVLSETIIDSQAYNNYILSSGTDAYGNNAYWGDSAKTYYANNYANSSIRQWLNNDFYYTAFSTSQQNLIQLTTIDNSAYSTTYSAYGSASTTDKIFLLSWSDTLNSNYGFSTSSNTYDTARRTQSSDYARCQGLWVSTSSSYSGNSYWRLRSAGDGSYGSCGVYCDGGVYDFYSTNDANFGVRAALKLNLSYVISQSEINPDDDSITIKLNYGEDIPNFGMPIRFGYIFIGWDKDIPNKMPGEDLMITAKWGKCPIVTFDNGGVGAVFDQITIEHNTSLTEPTEPVATGYTFKGWYTDKEYTKEYDFNTILNDDITIFANWEINTYTITFDTTGGIEIPAIVQNYNTVITAPENPTKEGYTFGGWDKTIPDTMPAEDMTITAIWNINEYTLSFDGDGTEKLEAKSVVYGSNIKDILDNYFAEGKQILVDSSKYTYPQTPHNYANSSTYDYFFNYPNAKELVVKFSSSCRFESGYDYLYLYNGSGDEIGKYSDTELASKTITIDGNSFSIKVITDSSNNYYGFSIDSIYAQPKSKLPTKKGYTLVSWNNLPETMPAEDITISPIWVANEYTITFNTFEGSVIEPIIQEYGSAIIMPDNPTKKNYTFLGWDKNAPSNMPDEDLTFNAKWKENTYSITYKTYNGSSFSTYTTQTKKCGDSVYAASTPSRSGYTFKGWLWCTDEGTMPETMPGYNITVYALWMPNNACPDGHTVSLIDSETPTCTKAGQSGGTYCPTCKKFYDDGYELPALGHDIFSHVIRSETCTEKGKISNICNKCGYTSEEETSALGHSKESEELTKNPNCTDKGEKTYTCHCGYKWTEEVDENGHKFEIFNTIEKATCAKEGKMKYTCSVCKYSYVETLKMLEHKTVTDEAVAVTCTKDGLTEGSHCSLCNTVFKKQEVITATGHSYKEFVLSEASCSEDGRYIKICSKCGLAETDEDAEDISLSSNVTVPSSQYPASAHDYSNNMNRDYTLSYSGAKELVITFSTSTYFESGYDYLRIYDKNGSLIGKYSGSELSGKTVTIPGEYVRFNLTTDSSVTKYGFSLTKVTAIVTDYSKAKVYTTPATEHDYEEIITKVPTCKETGECVKRCKKCGEYVKDDTPIYKDVTADKSTYPTMPHNYESNKTYEYSFAYPNTKEIKVTFSDKCKFEKDYDFCYIYDGSNTLIGTYTDTDLAGKTVTISGDSFKIKVITDNTANYYGFEISSIVAATDASIKKFTKEKSAHAYLDTVSKAATPTTSGQLTRICKVCGASVTETIPATVYSVGEIVTFGSYPQSKVTDTNLISNLNNQPTTWKSYDYYTGNGTVDNGKMAENTFMMYTDVTYNGQKYRGVTFDKYRPYNTGLNAVILGTYSNQDDSNYYISRVYWFKYEPLEWRILDPTSGLVMCESIVDAQPYNQFLSKSGSSWYGSSGYASKYDTSSIRQWLNDDFYNTAFTDEQKSSVLTTNVNNLSYESLRGDKKSTIYDGATTKDKVFLLSYEQIQNIDYKFSSNVSSDTARVAKGTDYARCQGLSYVTGGYSSWYLRTPYKYSNEVCYVDSNGASIYGQYVNDTSRGIRPAIRISTISHTGGAASLEQYYNVTYMVGSETLAVLKIEPGAPVLQLATVSKAGCAFSGFDVPDEMPNKNITVSGEYLPLYTAKFVANGVTVEEVKYTTATTALFEPAVPEKVGKVGTWGEYTLKAGGITINAVYENDAGHNHSYTSKVTKEANCTTSGILTFTCACGNTYTNVIPVTEHKDTNKDGLCDVCKTITNPDLLNPCRNAKINAAAAKTVDYRTKVTIKATASNVPEGYHLAIYIGGSKAAVGSNTEVSYENGETMGNIEYSVKVVDEKGNVQKDANGNDLTKDGGKITCDSGFFKKLAAFFKGLFNSLPSVTVKP